jgi:hypothetical protein
MPAKSTLKYSLIVLAEDKQKDFAQFIRNLYDLLDRRQKPFEIIIMANGTGGFFRSEIEEFQDLRNRIKAFEFNSKVTQAACLKAGLKESNGEIIVVCGSYQQITNDSFIDCLDSLDNETDIICPWRQDRVDASFNKVQSKVFNAIVRKLAGFDIHDLGCTLKIFRREVLEATEFYGNMYQFLPILAAQKGFKTTEVKCKHYQQRGKTGLRNLSLLIPRLLDIFTLYFNTRFTRKPLRFFSAIGLLFLVAGTMIVLVVFAQKLIVGYPIGGRPILLLALLFMVLGVQAASVGLLAEIVVFTHGRHRKEFTVEKIIRTTVR